MSSMTLTTKENNVLARLGVTALVLFGSRAQGIARAESDFDFGVLVNENALLFDRARRNVLYDALYELLSAKINQLVDIDIVFLAEAPMELQIHVARHGEALFERRAGLFVSFREYVFERYADFAPLRALFNTQTLARITT